jgi:hypothetical protein
LAEFYLTNAELVGVNSSLFSRFLHTVGVVTLGSVAVTWPPCSYPLSNRLLELLEDLSSFCDFRMELIFKHFYP